MGSARTRRGRRGREEERRWKGVTKGETLEIEEREKGCSINRDRTAIASAMAEDSRERDHAGPRTFVVPVFLRSLSRHATASQRRDGQNLMIPPPFKPDEELSGRSVCL